MTRCLTDRIRIRLDSGTVVVRPKRIAAHVFDFEVTTTSPGRGGLYGGMPAADTPYANEFAATIAALHIARQYWRRQSHDLLAREIDSLLTDYCFDCDDATDTDQF